MLDYTAALLRRLQEALIGHAVLVIAENVPHMGEELQQHVAEVSRRLEVGPLRQLLRYQGPHRLQDTVIVAGHVIDRRAPAHALELRHGPHLLTLFSGNECALPGATGPVSWVKRPQQ